jgi:hypothetical protein
MSDESRPGQMEAHGTLSISGRATLSAQYGRTGRTITADADYTVARSWAELPDERYDTHAAARRFREALPRVPVVAGERVYVRGRRPRNGAPTALQMGPAPHAQEGRYNAAGDSVLYLSESEAGVVAELPGDKPLWLQWFVLPAEFRIADFSALNAGDFFGQVFWHAELAGNSDVRFTQAFSRFVAGLVSLSFDGMKVPGVRGGADHRYCNVVVFRAAPRWSDWLDAAPYSYRS